MKNRMCCLLLSALLTAAFFCAPVQAQEDTEPVQAEDVEVTDEEMLSGGAEAEAEPEEPAFAVMAMAEPEDSTPTAVIPIRQVKALPPDTEGVTLQGTVVWMDETTALVQDATGGLYLALPEQPEVAVGDILLVTGASGEPFWAAEVTKQGSGDLPAAEVQLSEAPEDLRIVVRGGTLENGYLTQGGCSIAVLADEIPEGTADVYGIILDGRLHADTIVLPTPPEVPSEEPPERPDRQWNVYFGLLDAHTDISDGMGTVQQAFAYAAGVEGLDFFAVTDHSDSLDNAESGSITADGSAISARWAAGKQAAAAVTNESFVGIFGYEMTWGEDKALGHINTFHTPGWQTRNQPGFGTLEGYYRALQQVPGAVSQFNHPGLAYGDFHNFQEYDPDYDAVMQLLQVEGENGASFYPYYIRALDAGWHVAPTVGQDNHHGQWGSAGDSRTAMLARELTEDALYQAMLCRRVYATQDPDLYVDYRLNGHSMGSVIGVTDALEVSVVLDDPTEEAIGTVEVISSGGRVLESRQLEKPFGELTISVPNGYPYYFLRITQPDGDTAVTAPVWVDDFTDMGIGDFSADTDSPLAGQSVTLTLTLFNHETEAFAVTSVDLLHDGRKIGGFTASGALEYTCPLLWEAPGEVRLTAVVQGTVDGKERIYRKNLTLHLRSAETIPASIGQVRSGSTGTVYEVVGYATSGNTNAFTTFPGTIYVQDDTGGIPAVGEFTQKIQVGTPLQITGVLRERENERYLDLIDCQVLSTAMYRYVPENMGCREATDYTKRGGSLVQTEGTVTDLTLTPDGQGVSRFTLRDSRGDTAQVVIDPEIRSGAYGVNRLASQVRQGQTVRAMGLLHREADGGIVLRVRNCDEVVYVPPVPDRSNPQTGDGPLWHFLWDFLRELG